MTDKKTVEKSQAVADKCEAHCSETEIKPVEIEWCRRCGGKLNECKCGDRCIDHDSDEIIEVAVVCFPDGTTYWSPAKTMADIEKVIAQWKATYELAGTGDTIGVVGIKMHAEQFWSMQTTNRFPNASGEGREV